MSRSLSILLACIAVHAPAMVVLAQDPAPAPIVPPPPLTPLPAGSGVEPLPPDAEPPVPAAPPKPTKGKPAPPPPVIRPPGEEGKASTPLPPKAIEVPPAAQREGDRPSRLYVQTGAGVSIIPDLTLKGFPPTDFGAISEIGFASGTLATDVGVAWSLLVGFRISERFSIEVESGYTTNNISGFSGSTTELAGSPPTQVPGTFLSTQDGTLSMIPIFCNVAYELPLLERRDGRDESCLSLRLAGGFGATQLDMSVERLLVVSTAPVDGQTFGIDGTSWQIAGQFRADLLWNLSSNVDLGVSWRLMYMGAPTFGGITFSDSADFESAGDFAFSDTWAQSIQGSLNFRF